VNANGLASATTDSLSLWSASGFQEVGLDDVSVISRAEAEAVGLADQAASEPDAALAGAVEEQSAAAEAELSTTRRIHPAFDSALSAEFALSMWSAFGANPSTGGKGSRIKPGACHALVTRGAVSTYRRSATIAPALPRAILRPQPGGWQHQLCRA